MIMDNPLPYDTLDPSSFPLLYVYIGLTIVSWYMTIILMRNYLKIRIKTRKLLFYTFLSYSVCISIITAGFTQAVTTGYKYELYKLSLALGYSGILISNIFLIRFTGELLLKEMKNLMKYIIISIIIAILLILPINYYGVASEQIGDNFNLRPYSSSLMMLFSLITYIKIYLEIRKTSKKVDERLSKISFRMIGYSTLCMTLLFVFFFADLVLFGLTDLKGYTFFAYLGWISAGFFYIFSYLGLIMPDWFKNWIESQDDKKITEIGKNN